MKPGDKVLLFESNPLDASYREVTLVLKNRTTWTVSDPTCSEPLHVWPANVWPLTSKSTLDELVAAKAHIRAESNAWLAKLLNAANGVDRS